MFALSTGLPSALADVDSHSVYACSTATGPHEATVELSGRLPKRGSIGNPVELNDFKVAVTVPLTVVQDGSSHSQDLSSVTGSARLSVLAQTGEGDDSLDWSPFSVAGVKSTDGDSLRIVGTVRPSPLTVDRPAEVALSVGAIELSLNVDPAGAAGGIAKLVCTPSGSGRLGSIGFAGSEQARAVSAADSAEPEAEARYNCEALQPATRLRGMNPDPKLSMGDLQGRPADAVPGAAGDGQPECAKMTGFATIKKLGASVPIAASANIRMNPYSWTSKSENYIGSEGYLKAETKDSRGSALGFGFMPTSMVSRVVQVAGPESEGSDVANLRGDTIQAFNLPRNGDDLGWVRGFVRVQAVGARVNGVAVPLGDKCESGRAFLQLNGFLGNAHVGHSQLPYGGEYTTDKDIALTIPKFAGCGVDEDLSPLLDAVASGEGNTVRAISGAWCSPSTDCSDQKYDVSTVSVSPGGVSVAKAEPFVIPGTGGSIECDSATVRLKFRAGRWHPQAGLATGDMAFDGCVSQPSGQPITVTALADVVFGSTSGTYATGGDVTINGVRLSAKAPDGCTIGFGLTRRVPLPPPPRTDVSDAAFNGKYDPETGIMSPSPSYLYSTPDSSCPTNSIPGFTNNFAVHNVSAKFAFNPIQRITSP